MSSCYYASTASLYWSTTIFSFSFSLPTTNLLGFRGFDYLVRIANRISDRSCFFAWAFAR